MNAPPNIFPPHLMRFVEQVKTFIPGCHGRELELRCRLMSARETASMSLSRGVCSDIAAGVLEEMVRLGSRYAYAPLSVDQLGRLIEAQRAMIKAATLLDEFAEGDGARG